MRHPQFAQFWPIGRDIAIFFLIAKLRENLDFYFALQNVNMTISQHIGQNLQKYVCVYVFIPSAARVGTLLVKTAY